ncbi:FAD dependent oxidoreductase [Limtongia smithiae]|uniref:FAD dependent oxidoreductase n=1 Tax=Limtongia smithiae TaxID=1125753 RepID=UPI0034CE4BBF
MSPVQSKTSKIAIIGCGEFGLSTAYYLLLAGYKSVTLFDRSTPPVPDGSSVDISRIVRADYDDVVYARMVVEALEGWHGEYSEYYSECGLLCMTPDGNPKYLADALATVSALGLPVMQFASGEDAAKNLHLHNGALQGLSGYLSREAGWAYASKAVGYLFNKCLELGAVFVPKAVSEIVYSTDGPTTVTGLKLEDRTVFPADLVIAATGAWTDSLVPLSSRTLATGQPVAFVQLTDAEYEATKHLPVYINFVSGFYAFPPHPESKIVKAARHSYGYTNYLPAISEQGRMSSQPPSVCYSQGEVPEARTHLPKDADDCIRKGLEEYLGANIASRHFSKARICWYNDTPSHDFLFDYMPGVSNLFIATGGSGHAFKFLPVLGKYVVGCLEKTLDECLLAKFGWRDEVIKTEDESRGGTPIMSLQDAELA